MTWQQIVADEKLENVFPAIESVYKEKSRLRANSKSIVDGCNFNFYDMHDGKMLYLMTQHLLWSRKYHPFFIA